MRKRKKIQAIRRPWQQMENAVWQGDPNDPVQQAIEGEEGYVGVFINDLYQVTYREVETMLFSDPGTAPRKVAWLCIRRKDSEAVHDWRHLQNIKNDLCGPEYEAMEIYPAESRLVDSCNQYHLWVLPKGLRVPFGYEERDVSDQPFGKNKQRPFEDRPADLNAIAAQRDMTNPKELTVKIGR